MLVGTSLGKSNCYIVRIMGGVYLLAGGTIFLEVFIVRYLYTTFWQNLGMSHIDFWKAFFRIFHICLYLWIGSVLSWLNLRLDSDMAVCNNIRAQELPFIYRVIIFAIVCSTFVFLSPSFLLLLFSP